MSRLRRQAIVASRPGRSLTALGLLAVFALSAAPGAGGVDLRGTPSRTFVTDGAVDAIVPTSTAIYIGGSFTSVGPRTGPGVGINVWTANSRGLPEVFGGKDLVQAVASDGSGGFYIGGQFNHVGNLPRRNLAHILPNGKVDPSFKPNPDDEVDAIAVSGQTVYVGGYFTSIGARSRNFIAALDATTGDERAGTPTPRSDPPGAAVSTHSQSRARPSTPAGSSTRSAASRATASVPSTPRPARRRRGTRGPTIFR